MVDAEGKLQDTCNLFPIVAFALEGRLALLAGAYPGRVRHGHVIVDFKDVHNPTTFANLVADYNEARKKQGKPALIIALPDYTDEQLDLDALRGFNGYTALDLHEFRVATDEQGMLLAQENGDGKTGQAQWMRVSAEERREVYDARRTPLVIEAIQITWIMFWRNRDSKEEETMKQRIWTGLPLCLAILALGAAPPPRPAKPAQETEFRSMYVMSCGGWVNRLDIVSDRVLESFVLDERFRKQHLFPDAGGHLAPDGCLANGAAYDRVHSIVYTVAPVELHMYGPEGLQHFRVLGFHLPDFQLVEVAQIEEPLIEAQPEISFQHGRLQVTTWDGHLFTVPTGVARGVAKLVSIEPSRQPKLEDPDFSSLLGNPQAKDLDQFARTDKETGRKELLTNWLRASGGTDLVQVLHGEEEPLVIAAIHGRHAVVLHGLPQTTPGRVYLTPGGQYVYVEEALPPINSLGSRKTGRVALFEAATGKMLRNWTIPGIQDQIFLAFTPTGKVIYFHDDNFTFEQIAPSFPDLPVEPMASSLKWFFTSF